MAQSLNLSISIPRSTKYSLPISNYSVSRSVFFSKNPSKTSLCIRAAASEFSPSVLTSENGVGGGLSTAVSDSSSIEIDTVTEAELKENGFRSTRRTKLICTIGPVTCMPEQLEALAVGGMNVARINMCHGTREWHREVIQRVRRLNEEKGYAVAIMMDTEGSEIHMGDLGGASSAKAEVHSDECVIVLV